MQNIFPRRSFQYYRPAFTIRKRYLTAVKSLPCRILTAAAVKIISGKRKTDVGKVYPYLMRSSCFKFYSCIGIFSAGRNDTVICYRVLSVRCNTSGYE